MSAAEAAVPRALVVRRRPRTDEELWWFVKAVWGIDIPRERVCAGHVAPFEAFADAYFARHRISVWHASRGFGGKCAAASDDIMAADGCLTTYGALAGKSVDVPTPAWGGTAWTSASFAPNGREPVWAIRLETGAVLKRTGHHRLWIGGRRRKRGEWKFAGDVRAGDWVLMPDRVAVRSRAATLGTDEAFLVGCLLGDGGLTHAIGFSAATRALMERCCRIAETLGARAVMVRPGQAVFRSALGGKRYKGPVRAPGKFRLADTLHRLGLKGKDAFAKRLPPDFYGEPDDVLAAMLNGLLATDGEIGARRVVYGSRSEALRDAVAWMAHRVGAVGVRRTRHMAGKPFFMWECQAWAVPALLRATGPVVGKEAACDAVLRKFASAPYHHRWRKQRGTPDGFHWQRVAAASEAGVDDTVCVTTGTGAYCGPAVEHNSFLLATLAMTEQVTLGAYVTLLGGSGAQSARVHEYMRNMWASRRAPRRMLVGDPTIRETRLSNGGHAQALMASGAQTRGPHPSRLRLDEVDEMDLAVFDAAMGQPMSVPGVDAQTVCSSTHHYPDGTMTEVLKRAGDKGWPTFSWCYKETVRPHGWLPATEVEAKRNEVTAVMFETEYDLQEPNPEGRAIQPEAVDAAFRRGLGQVAGTVGKEYVFEPRVDGAIYVHGADWAKEKDYTVAVTLRIDERPARMVAFQRTRRRPWPAMARVLDDRIAAYGGSAAHDNTGLGNVVADLLTHDAYAMNLVGRDRKDLLSDYVGAIERGEIAFPRVAAMYDEHRFAKVADIYGGVRGGHLPDTVAAGALAWHLAAPRAWGAWRDFMRGKVAEQETAEAAARAARRDPRPAEAGDPLAVVNGQVTLRTGGEVRVPTAEEVDFMRRQGHTR